MEKRELGNSGIKVHPFCLGSNVFGWTIDEKKSFEVLDAYIDLGLEFIDTADVYARWAPDNKGGESETIIGNWIKSSGKRDKIILATKVGKPMGEGKEGLSRANITQAVDASLKRLKTDYIDLYQSHADDPDTSLTETLGTFTDLIKQGKVRAIGASNYSTERLKEALNVSREHNLARYESIQPEYNLYDRDEYEKDLQALCLENNIGAITYYALASGFLTGKYRSESDLSKSQRGGNVKKYLNDRGYSILSALDEVANKYNTTPATIAIAWIITQPGITAPIASATSVQQLKELIEATKINLDAESINLLNK